MNEAYPRVFYRRFSGRTLSQGDIALAEFHQLRAPGGEPAGPGERQHTAPNLPYLGSSVEDHQITYTRDDRQEVHRILRVWQGFVMLVTQNCEIEFRNDSDSRLQIAPIVSRNQWPEGPWHELQGNRVPGYFYLPPLPAEEADSLGLPMPWPESVVVLASGCLSSIRLIKPRRQLALSVEAMIHLQDSLVRFYSVRGFAAVQDFDALRGKRLIKVVDANHTVQGPSRLMKMYLGENEAEVDERDDEATVTFFGFRT